MVETETPGSVDPYVSLPLYAAYRDGNLYIRCDNPTLSLKERKGDPGLEFRAIFEGDVEGPASLIAPRLPKGVNITSVDSFHGPNFKEFDKKQRDKLFVALQRRIT